MVANTQSQEWNDKGGTGLHVQEEAQVEVVQSVFTKNRAHGIIIFNANTQIKLQDVVIAHTIGSNCSICPAGLGVSSYGGAYIEMDRFIISKNAHCGAQLSYGKNLDNTQFDFGGKMKLSNGIISQNELCGINVQTKNIDLDDLSENVLYFENNYNNL